MNNAANVARHLGTLTLQHIRRTTEAEAIARANNGESGQAILGLKKNAAKEVTRSAK